MRKTGREYGDPWISRGGSTPRGDADAGIAEIPNSSASVHSVPRVGSRSQSASPAGCNNRRVTDLSLPVDVRGDFSRPAARVAGDWSAHIATTLDRLSALLDDFDEATWSAPSLCEGWRVRDVVGHLVWRLGSSSGDMVRSGLSMTMNSGFNANRAIDRLAKQHAAAPTDELIACLRSIAASKMRGEGRTGIVEITEAVVHTYDITEALGLTIRLSPRSTGAVALSRTRAGGRSVRLAKTHSLRAVDARWQIGTGAPIDATAGEIIMHLFGRRALPNAEG